MPQHSPTLSILTPSFNQGAFIGETIRSVSRQDYAPVEHIVIDGGSRDNTLEVLRQHPHLIWKSEPDRGQADALNKGLAMARGEFVGWINSDDFYCENVFGSVMDHFRTTGADWLIGNLADVYDDDVEPIFRRSPAVTHRALLQNADIVRQQCTFFRRHAIEAAGGWSPEFFMAMDFDLWTRLASKASPRMVDENWAFYRNHAAQKSSGSHVLRQSQEISRILRREGAPLRYVAAQRLLKRWYWFKTRTKLQMIDLGIIPKQYRSRPVRS